MLPKYAVRRRSQTIRPLLCVGNPDIPPLARGINSEYSNLRGELCAIESFTGFGYRRDNA